MWQDNQPSIMDVLYGIGVCAAFVVLVTMAVTSVVLFVQYVTMAVIFLWV